MAFINIDWYKVLFFPELLMKVLALTVDWFENKRCNSPFQYLVKNNLFIFFLVFFQKDKDFLRTATWTCQSASKTKIYATNFNCPLDDEAIREPNKDSI